MTHGIYVPWYWWSWWRNVRNRLGGGYAPHVQYHLDNVTVDVPLGTNLRIRVQIEYVHGY
jgi:hypothetical protein